MASQPEPPDRPERMAFERTGGSGTRLQVGIALVLGFVLAAILKPWDWGQPSVDTNPPGSAAAIAAARTSPSPKPTLDPRAVPCLTYSAWRAMTIERTSGEEVHRWIVVDPVAATDPLDPGIPSVRVVAGRLDGMGYCAPDGAAAAATPTVYRITDGTAEILNEATPLSLLVPTGEHAALIFQPPQATDTWSPGRYVLKVLLGPVPEGGPGVPSSAWFAIDVEQAASDPVQADRPSPFSPPPSP